MPLQDNFGVAWAHSNTVKAGDKLRCDGGFTCLAEGDVREVKASDEMLEHCTEEYKADPFAKLYIECSDGTHRLDGQVGDDGELVGLYPA